MANVELIAIGTELLLGQLVDTNTPFVAQEMAKAGIDVRAAHTVGDNRERIATLVSAVLERADGVISTGGLGPTVDDLTKEAVCDALNLGVELYEPALLQMEKFFTASGREMRPNNRKQAELPRGSRPLDNPNGTAPGFVAFAPNGTFVACMPGVPHEMKPMLEGKLVPLLRKRFASTSAIYTRVLHTIGIGESEIDHRIEDLFRSSENPKVGVLAHDFRADVKIMAKSASLQEAQRMIAPLQHEIAARLDGFVFGADEATPASAIHERLQAHGRTIATAESCTGGRIAAALTSIPGSSGSFVGGIIAYDNAIKISELGVDAELIERDGAVSEAVARAMARGACERLHTDYAIATTGIAGPGGGTPDKPVGLVWFALHARDGTSNAWYQHVRGDREAIQARAAISALGAIWRFLTSEV